MAVFSGSCRAGDRASHHPSSRQGSREVLGETPRAHRARGVEDRRAGPDSDRHRERPARVRLATDGHCAPPKHEDRSAVALPRRLAWFLTALPIHARVKPGTSRTGSLLWFVRTGGQPDGSGRKPINCDKRLENRPSRVRVHLRNRTEPTPYRASVAPESEPDHRSLDRL